MFCTKCGKELDDSAIFCPACGVPTINYQQNFQQHNQTQEQPTINVVNTNTNKNIVGFGHAKNKWVSFCLCLFLGFFGAHKFYEGRILLGILYLVTFGVFGIGWFIDIFVILFKPNPYFV